ncbi:hypothetical protein PV04_05439 [Phialophora macrospora]|uniref:C2H2-type domain-containing protein n=1 Tax=Phialophora macrospora TaxID=1851006 RepID=A0A0D2GBY7_9EURO|nr:hypothetical protein PV04_05439 [Phialophora macrospora]
MSQLSGKIEIEIKNGKRHHEKIRSGTGFKIEVEYDDKDKVQGPKEQNTWASLCAWARSLPFPARMARMFGMPDSRSARPSLSEGPVMQSTTRAPGAEERSESSRGASASSETEFFLAVESSTAPRSDNQSIPASREILFKTPQRSGRRAPALRARIHVWDINDGKAVQRRDGRRANSKKRHRHRDGTRQSKRTDKFRSRQRRSQKLSRRRRIMAAAVRSREVMSGTAFHLRPSDEYQTGPQSTTPESTSHSEGQREIMHEKKSEDRRRQCRHVSNPIVTLAASEISSQAVLTPRATSTPEAPKRTDIYGRIIPEAVPSPGDAKDATSQEAPFSDCEVARECTPTSVAPGIVAESTALTTSVPTSRLDTALHSRSSTRRVVAQEWWREQAAKANVAAKSESQETEHASIKCNQCSRAFATESGLNRHSKLLHRSRARLWDCENKISQLKIPRSHHPNIGDRAKRNLVMSPTIIVSAVDAAAAKSRPDTKASDGDALTRALNTKDAGIPVEVKLSTRSPWSSELRS